MKIDIKIFGFLNDAVPSEFRGNNEYFFDGSNLTIHHLIRNILSFKIDEVIILLNDKFLTNDEFLKDGDRITIFPPIAGG
jgi:sulfur carrier protein ThiS